MREKVKGLEERLEDVEELLRGTKYSLGDYLVPEPSTSENESIPQPPLQSTIATLSSRNASLSSSLATLTQSHTDSLHTTQHLIEELNSMRNVIGGMRMQMGDLLRTVQVLTSQRGAAGFSSGRIGIAGGGGMLRPEFKTRRSDSDSSNPDQEQLNLELQDMLEPYLSSSSDPEEDSSLFYPHSHPSQRFISPPALALPPGAQRYSYQQYQHPQSWPNGMSYVGGGNEAPSLFNYQGIGRPAPLYPVAGGVGASRRNGRIVGGIGGGMKL